MVVLQRVTPNHYCRYFSSCIFCEFVLYIVFSH
jgi:hypothetical protein